MIASGASARQDVLSKLAVVHQDNIEDSQGDSVRPSEITMASSERSEIITENTTSSERAESTSGVIDTETSSDSVASEVNPGRLSPTRFAPSGQSASYGSFLLHQWPIPAGGHAAAILPPELTESTYGHWPGTPVSTDIERSYCVD